METYTWWRRLLTEVEGDEVIGEFVGHLDGLEKYSNVKLYMCITGIFLIIIQYPEQWKVQAKWQKEQLDGSS